MEEPLDGLRRADEGTGAAPRRLALLADGDTVADRAFGMLAAGARQLGAHREGTRIRRTLLRYHRDDLRDDVAGALHDDHVAVAEILARDLILVVQRRAGDDDAADIDRLEIG